MVGFANFTIRSTHKFRPFRVARLTRALSRLRMIELGNSKLVGFRVSSLCTDSPALRYCQIFIGGECVSDCKREYLPFFRKYFAADIERYRSRLNFLAFEDELLEFDNLTEIHNAFVHEDYDIGGAVERACWHCGFLQWYGPHTTDLFKSFLIPFRGQTWLTWQKWVNREIKFPRLDVVDCMEVNPYDLIDNFRKCLTELDTADAHP